MKSWLFSFTLLVLLCICIETLKLKDGKSKIKHNEGKHKTSKESEQDKINSKPKDRRIVVSKHTNGQRTSKQAKKHPRENISWMLHELRKCINIKLKNVTCMKGKKNAKKAMIWPKKMLPNLEKILLNKINGGGNDPGDNNGDNGYENYDNPSDNSYGNAFPPTSPTFGKSEFSDNWDSVNPRHHNKNKFHGMEVVPLLKMLKENVGDSSSFDSNAFTGMPSNQGNSKYLTKLLLNQAIGKPDKGSVMKDMMQEFYLANGNERSGEEAREAFNELMGHNNLIGMNSQMEAENSDVNVGPSQGLPGMREPIGRQGIAGKIQSFGSQAAVLQAQELPNGQIAPLNQPAMGQRMIASRPVMEGMMPQTANPSTRMLNNENALNVPNNVPNIPSMTNVQNVASVPTALNNVVENQLAARMAEEQPDEPIRPVPFAQNDNLIFEEQGESVARGIRPPPFKASQRAYDAERVMKLAANYRSSPIPEPQRHFVSPVPQRVEMAMRDGEENVVGIQGERFGNEVAAFIPGYPQQDSAARRDDLPSSHKHTASKVTVRSKGLPKPQSKKNRT